MSTKEKFQTVRRIIIRPRLTFKFPIFWKMQTECDQFNKQIAQQIVWIIEEYYKEKDEHGR